METDPNGRVRQMLKVVQVMDCISGHARSADGPHISILTLGHCGHIEEPLMLSHHDTRRLVGLLVTVLAAHGDVRAKELLRGTFVKSMSRGPDYVMDGPRDPQPLEVGDEREVFVASTIETTRAKKQKEPQAIEGAPTRQAAKAWTRRLTRRSASAIKYTVQYGRYYRPRNRFYPIGGYTDSESIFVLARRRASGGYVEDGVAKLALPNRIILRANGCNDWLPDAHWEDFLARPDGSSISIAGKAWRKLALADIIAIVGGKTFKAIQ